LPDAVVVNHLRLTQPLPDRGSYVDNGREFQSIVPDLGVRYRSLEVRGNAVLIYTDAFGHAHDGGEVVWSTWGVQVIAGDLITHVELFDPEDEAAARAKFAELAVLGSRQVGRPRLWNTALRVTEAMTPAFTAQDLDTITAFWHPDFTLFDRRRGPSAPPVI